MGLFDIFKKEDINTKIIEYQNDKDAVLLDVRSREEYREGHIEGSVLMPLDEIYNINEKVKDKNKRIYVYCRSGARAGRAVEILRNLGYTNAVNIGGIMSYKGGIKK